MFSSYTKVHPTIFNIIENLLLSQLFPSLSSHTSRISGHMLQNKQLPYHMTRRGFGFHHIWLQCPTPVLPASAYFNKFAVLATYIFCLCCQFRLSTSFPVFFPHTQTGYECMFHLLAYLSSTIARTLEHQCLLFLCSCLLMQRHSGTSA